MQALQMSGLAAEIRDPLPVREPVNGEVDNSEHPFRKLLAKLRNTMMQGDRPGQGELDGVSKLGPEYYPKATARTGSVSLNGTGSNKPEGSLQGVPGLQQNATLVIRNGVPKSLEETGPKVEPDSRESSQTSEKGKLRSSLSGRNAAMDTVKGKVAGETSDPDLGKASGVAEAVSFVKNALQSDQKKPSGPVDHTRTSETTLNTGTVPERRRNSGGAPGLDGAIVAASGTLKGAMNLAGMNHNHNSTTTRNKSGLDNPVDEVKTSGLRPSRYSVVDLRLRASAGKASIEVPADGKPEGKPAGTAGPDFNRSGQSGTDAAGRQIGNDQPASGFSELSRAAGAEGSDKAPASFADNLAARLRDGGSMDIVRSAQIVLKDGDAGLIRLRLEPESLGGVKIELKMADKQISARIIVESDLAGEAFRSSLDSLRDAFASSGFETTSIEVEVRDGRAGTGDAGRGDSQDNGDEESRRLYAARKIEELGDAVPSADAAYGRYGVIDLVV
jgi:hypothetical protein